MLFLETGAGGTAMPISFFSVRNIDELDFTKLVRQLPPAGSKGGVRRGYVRTILESQDLLKRYGIDNPNRLAHFLAQGVVETGALTKTVEYMNYSAQRLPQVWPSRFRTEEIAREYAGQPERLANFVYGGRLGNGPPESGDGWTYRGRGFFQLTGRENYRNFGRIAGFDLENNPSELEDMKKSIEVAAAYFQAMGLGAYADADNIPAVSRGVNRGDPTSTIPAHGEAERIHWTDAALNLVKDPQSLLARTSNDATLRPGATGDRVRAVQQDLADLGYPVGAIDGVFGPATRRALINFQEERRLQTTGVVDEPTRAALDAEFAPIAVNVPTAQAPLETSAQQLDTTPTPPVPELATEAEQPEPEAPVETPPPSEPQPEVVAEAPHAAPSGPTAESSPNAPAPDAAVNPPASDASLGASPNEPAPDAAPSAPASEAMSNGSAQDSVNGGAGELSDPPPPSVETKPQAPQPQP
jgi:putative chitinase